MHVIHKHEQRKKKLIQQLVFQCVNDTKTNPPTKQESHVNPQSGVRTLEATAEISLAYFEQFFVTPFTCECIARNSGGEVKSRSATIVLARKSTHKKTRTHVGDSNEKCFIQRHDLFCRSREEFHHVAAKRKNRAGKFAGDQVHVAERQSASCALLAEEQSKD